VYRVVDAAPGASKPSTEVVEVRRPYDGRVEDRIGGHTTTGRITSRAHFWQLGPRGALEFGVLRPPGGPARDASYPALLDAVRAGQAEDGGSDRVLHRTCRWFAYRDPAPKPILPPTAHSRVESCVDASGIVLREAWTLAGKAARVLEAIELERVAPPKRRFLEGHDPSNEKVTNEKAGALIETQTLVRDVAQGQIASPFAFHAPKGWRRDRVAVAGVLAGQGARPTQFLSRTYLRNEELVVVETGSSPEFGPPWPTDQGTRIRVGVGHGRMVFGIDRVEIRVLSALGYARVIAPDEAIARMFLRGLSG
jgi:hypothetical protein